MNAVERTIAEIEAQDAENAREEHEYLADPEVIRNNELQDLISTLNNINFQIAELSRIKEALEPKVSALLQHGEDGSKSYTAGRYKVTVTTGYNYTLDKEEYAILGSRIPACFNIVTQRIAYDLNKTAIRDAEKYASAEELDLISKMVLKKPKKLHVKISAGV